MNTNTLGDPSAVTAPVDGLSLRAVKRRFGARIAVDGVDLDVGRGEVLCILGPSGCGKSTILRIAAGLETLDFGQVFVAGKLMEGDAEGRHCHVPPERRGVGLMFQDYALFPHLSVKGNVGFGLAGLASAKREACAIEELARVGLAHLADAYPHSLSGGEQQRVALARMLAPAPDVVLMDEPFSGLDASLRESLRVTTLKRLRQARAAVVIVTHDPDEAMRIGDRIALMRAGRIVQVGSPLEVYGHPIDPQVATLFGGANRFTARATAGGATSPFGRCGAGSISDGERVQILFRPSAVWVAQGGVRARVLAVHPVGGGIEVEAEIDPAAVPAGSESPPLVRASVPGSVAPGVGTEIYLEARPEDAFVFPCLDPASQA